MDYELLEKMKVEELKNYLKIRRLKVTGEKKDWQLEYLLPVEMDFKLIEPNLITGYKNKLKFDDFQISKPFKILHGQIEEDKEMVFWPILSYPEIFNFLIFCPSELGSKDLTE